MSNYTSTLHSGKTINYIKTTEFAKDCDDLVTIFNKCDMAVDIAHSSHGNGKSDVIGPDWIYLYCTEDFGILLDNVIGGLFSTQCTRLYALERHIGKWRNIINQYGEPELKTVTSLKIDQAIKKLDQLKENGCDTLCGCSDPQREENENLTIKFYHEDGKRPGYITSDKDGFNIWVPTPHITPEEFESEFYLRQLIWRHDLQNLRDRFEAHRTYFKHAHHIT